MTRLLSSSDKAKPKPGTGKRLIELTHEVGKLHQDVWTVLDDKAAICWQDDNTLTYFSYDDGYPGLYWNKGHGDSKKQYTDFTRFFFYLKEMYSGDRYVQYLLASPVWYTGAVQLCLPLDVPATTKVIDFKTRRQIV